MTKSPKLERKLFLASLADPSLDPAKRKAFASSGNPELLRAVAKNPALTDDEKILLVQSGDTLVIKMMIRHGRGVSPRVADEILFRGSEAARKFFIANHTPEGFMAVTERLLAGEANPKSRHMLSRHLRGAGSSLPQDALLFVLGNTRQQGVLDACVATLRLHHDLYTTLFFQGARKDLRENLKKVLAHPTSVDASLTPYMLMQISEGTRPSYFRFCAGWSAEELSAPRLKAEELLAEAKAQVRPDFWDAFIPDWHESLTKFVEYARALDA